MTAAFAITEQKRAGARASLWRLAMISWSAISLGVGSARALDPQLAFTQYCRQDWSLDAELPYNDRAVFALAQTADGYLWLGADKGLLRFDGARFTVFDSKRVPAMKSITNRVLYAAADGSLWSGTGGGLLHFQEGRFTSFTREQGLLSDEIRAIGEAPAGTLWIGTPGGINRYQTNHVSTVALRFAPAGTGVSAICGAKDHRAIWLGLMNGGLIRMEGEKADTVIPGNAGDGLPIARLLEARDGALWIGQQDGKVTRLHNGIRTPVIAGAGLPNNFVDLLEDHNGVIWISLWKEGVWRWHQGALCPLQPPRGFFLEQSPALAEDREGGVWFAGSSGTLTRLHEGPVVSWSVAEGLCDDSARTVLAARDGSVWIGTEKGLAHFQNGQLDSFPAMEQFRDDCVLSLAEDSDGSLWIGTRGHGLKQLKEGRVTSFRAEDGLGSDEIRALYFSRNGTLWIGTRTAGLSRFDGQRFQRITRADGLAGDEVRFIYETSDGSLWLGLQGVGLTCWQNGKIKNYSPADGLANDQVRAIHEDNEGTLWIGTNDGGLSRFKHGRFHTYTTEEGLANETVFFIHEDSQGRLWMSSKRGIFSATRKELNDLADGAIKKLQCRVYGIGEGMKAVECAGGVQPAGCVTRDGRLWLPTERGVASLRPDQISSSAAAPRSHIESVSINQQMVESAVELPVLAGHRRIEFHYTAMTFQRAGKVRFRYRLEGLDPDWVDAGPRRMAEYPAVRPGTYTFHVQAGTPEGLWETPGSSLSLHVSARFYQTAWFWIICGGLVMAGAAGLYRLRIRYLRRIHLLEQQLAVDLERARIAQDVHDELGANLTHISLLCARATDQADDPGAVNENLEKIAATLREAFRSLSEIVWAVNPQHDKLESLVNYICKCAENYLRLAKIRCRLDVPEQLPALALPFAKRQHVFFVIKEALTNIIKHAKASEVWFRLELLPDEMVFSLEDNGCGFNVTNSSQFGNGLVNMRRRALEVGGRLEIHSASGQGTTIRVRLPMPSAVFPPANEVRPEMERTT